MPFREWDVPTEQEPQNALEQLQMQKLIASMQANPAAMAAYKRYKKTVGRGERLTKRAWMMWNFKDFQAENRFSDPHVEAGGLFARLPNLRNPR